jgi:hypothetical protein
MDENQIQTALQSRTIQLLIAVLVAYAVKNWGIQFAPVELQLAITEILTVAIPILIIGAGWFRVRATTIIKGWWS